MGDYVFNELHDAEDAIGNDDLEDAAADLVAAADYLKTQLDAGEPVLESKWLGAVMRAHEMLLTAASN